MIRRLDANGDIISSGKMWAYNAEAVGINVRTALQMFVGENFRDKNDGTPWFQQILGSEGRDEIVASQIKRRILGVEGVREITLFESVYHREQSQLALTVEIVTESGDFVKIGEVVI